MAQTETRRHNFLGSLPNEYNDNFDILSRNKRKAEYKPLKHKKAQK